MESEKDERLSRGIPTYRIWHRQSPIPRTSYFAHLWGVNRSFQRLRAQGFQPDLIHAHIYTAGFPAILLGKLNRLPVLISEHFSGFPRRLLTTYELLMTRFAFKHAAAVLPDSLALQRGIESYGIQANYQIVPNVADPSLFHHSLSANGDAKHPRRMLYVGNLVPVKGVPDLLNALPGLRAVRSDWVLDIVGDGTEREACEAIVRDQGLSEHVFFHGLQPKSAVAEFMRRSDFFVLPSHWDNSPCVIVEAMASGLPVVATRTGGIPEFVGEDSGLLVPPGEPGALSEALAKMLDKLDSFDRDHIMAKAEAYGPGPIGGKIHSLYTKFIQTKEA